MITCLQQDTWVLGLERWVLRSMYFRGGMTGGERQVSRVVASDELSPKNL